MIKNFIAGESLIRLTDSSVYIVLKTQNDGEELILCSKSLYEGELYILYKTPVSEVEKIHFSEFKRI